MLQPLQQLLICLQKIVELLTSHKPCIEGEKILHLPIVLKMFDEFHVCLHLPLPPYDKVGMGKKIILTD